MPLNVEKFGASWFLVLFSALAAFAQSPTSGEVMRERIMKIKAMVAVKSYTAAIYELEGIRRETNDPTVHSVAQVVLMNCYLEQSDYKRAQTLLAELYNQQKTNKPNANYFAVAAQVVKGARSQLDRYKSLGLTVSDRNLPLDAVADINKMRDTIETVITQSKTLGADKKQSQAALALLEESIVARSGLARDDYDAKRWKEEVADARESLMNSRSVVNAVDDSAAQKMPLNTIASNTNPPIVQTPGENNALVIPAASNANSGVNTESANTSRISAAQTNAPEKVKETAAPETTKQTAQTQNQTAAQTPNAAESNGAPSNQPPTRTRRVENSDAPNVQPNVNSSAGNNSPNTAQTSENTPKSDSPLAVGSLLEYATQKVNPVYPAAAKNVRASGVVRVELVVSEDGKIAQVKNASGPSMLQRAATDAVRQWKFKPFTRDGQPVKATGFVSFNFSL